MNLATFNVNSLKARLPVVLAWLEAHQPDVLMLQEIKGLEVPEAEFLALGYHCYADLQKTYHGVATLTRAPMGVVARRLPNLADDDQARIIALAPQGQEDHGPLYINIYAPNGNPVGSEKYAYKLRWLAALVDWLAALRALRRDVVVMGDFNIIPEAWDAAQVDDWRGDALFQDAARVHYRAMLNSGMVDAVRAIHPDVHDLYTFWDYQAGAWPRNLGIRIDHALLSPRLADRLVTATIDRAPRGQERPSDHTPLVVRLRD
jgi:exodeoxyribonuclease-3